MYNTTAFLYEATAAFEEQEQTADHIHDLLLQCDIHPPGVLGDLGSGTGLMAIELAQKGWCIQGIELTPSMLSVALEKRSRLPEEIQKRVTFHQGDITAFDPPNGLQWDGAICLHNTINHLTEWEQVEHFMRCAFNALKPGAILILDSDTQETFERFFHHDPTVVWDDGQHRLTRTCRFNFQSGRAHHLARVERYEPDVSALRFVSEEEMQLQFHPEKELFDRFVAAGFQPASVEPYNPNPALYSGNFIPKILWVLRKP